MMRKVRSWILSPKDMLVHWHAPTTEQAMAVVGLGSVKVTTQKQEVEAMAAVGAEWMPYTFCGMQWHSLERALCALWHILT